MRPHLYAVTFLLFASLSAHAQQTETEPNNDIATANAFTLGNTMSGTWCDGEAGDVFSIIAPLNGRLDVDLTAWHTSSQLNVFIYLHLYNATGEEIGVFTATSGPSSVHQSNPHYFTCLAAGQYFLEVVGPNPECNSYELTASLATPVFTQDAEDNDNAAQATLWAENTWNTGTINYSNYDDNADWYRIDLPEDGRLIINFQAMKQAAGSYIGEATLMDEDQNTLNDYNYSIAGLFNPNDTGFTTFDRSCLGAGTYYLRITSNNTCGTSYRIKWSMVHPVFPNDVEPNNTAAQAQQTTPGTWTGGHVNFDTYSDPLDYFKLDVPMDGLCTIQFQAIRQQGGSAYGQAVLTDGSGNELTTWPFINLGSQGSATDTAFTTLTQYCLAQGTYYMNFSTGNSCGVIYRFNWNMTPAPGTNDPEDNDAIANAVTLQPSTPADGHINFDAYDDNSDWYRFHVYGTADPSIDISASHQNGGDYYPSFDLTDASGTVILSPTYNLRPSSIFQVETRNLGTLDEGDHYLHFTSPVCGASYTITVNGIGTVGVEEVTAPVLNFSVSPNPSADGFFRIHGHSSPIAHVEVFDAQGRSVHTQRVAAGNDVVLDLSSEPEGLYYARVRDASGVSSFVKFIRTH